MARGFHLCVLLVVVPVAARVVTVAGAAVAPPTTGPAGPLAEARQLASEGKLPQALIQLAEAVRREPTNAVARHEYGLMLYRVGRTSEAVTELVEAVRLKPDLTQARKAMVSNTTSST